MCTSPRSPSPASPSPPSALPGGRLAASPPADALARHRCASTSSGSSSSTCGFRTGADGNHALEEGDASSRSPRENVGGGARRRRRAAQLLARRRGGLDAEEGGGQCRRRRARASPPEPCPPEGAAAIFDAPQGQSRRLRFRPGADGIFALDVRRPRAGERRSTSPPPPSTPTSSACHAHSATAGTRRMTQLDMPVVHDGEATEAVRPARGRMPAQFRDRAFAADPRGRTPRGPAERGRAPAHPAPMATPVTCTARDVKAVERRRRRREARALWLRLLVALSGVFTARNAG